MKTIIIFLLSISFCYGHEVDTLIYPYARNEILIMVPDTLFPPIDIVSIRYKKVTDTLVNISGGIAYYIESVGSNNAPGTWARLLTIQAPMGSGTEITPAEKKQLEDLINVITSPPDVPVPLDIISIIDNVPTDTRNVYSAGWTHAANATWLDLYNGKTGSYSAIAGSTLTTSFTGYKIEMFSEKRNNHGIAEIKVDGVVVGTVNLWDARTDNNSQKVFEWTGTQGTHTIEIRVTGTGNVADKSIIHDYFRVTSKQ